jgi:hypothetical protein
MLGVVDFANFETHHVRQCPLFWRSDFEITYGSFFVHFLVAGLCKFCRFCAAGKDLAPGGSY